MATQNPGEYLGIDWANYTSAPVPEQQSMMQQYQSNYNTDPAFQFNLDTPGFEESAPDYTPPNLQMFGADDATSDGLNWGTMQGWGQMLGGIGDIGKAYMAYKNYGLAKDQFDFSKQYANRNLENQAVTVNAALDSKQRARGGVGSGKRVNSSPIG